MKPRYGLLAILLVLAAGPARGAGLEAGPLYGTVRVLRDTPGPLPPPFVGLAAARNEWEGFQILVRSDQPVPGVTVEPGDLHGPDGAVLPAVDARLYRVHQLEITQSSPRNKDFKPGWYPDALIPFKHPLTGKPLAGARFTAVPFDLPAGQTHSFYVDLHVPADAKAGVYRGTYRVSAPGVKAQEIAVELTVWDLTLPQVPALVTAFGSPAGRLHEYYRKRAANGLEKEPASWAEVEEQCAGMLSEHRINATPTQHLWPRPKPDGTFEIPRAEVDALYAFLKRYHVNAIQIPHPDNAIKDPVAERDRLQQWLWAWDRASLTMERPPVFYIYLLDEPNDEPAYHYVQKWGKAIHGAHSKVKVLVVEQPQTQDSKWGDLYGAVDIWCPLFALFEPAPARQRMSLGEAVWTYTALCQGKEPTPWWQTDFPLLNYRVPAWIACRYGESGLLYWGGMAFWEHVKDPWTEPGTYDLRKNGKGPVYNGEGSLVYPARAVGYDGIAPSLRLKALRDAIDDYDYFALAGRKTDEARKIVESVAGSWTHWNSDPAAYMIARVRLAKLLTQEHAAP